MSDERKKEMEQNILARLQELEQEKADLEATMRTLRRLDGKAVINPKEVSNAESTFSAIKRRFGDHIRW